MELSIAHRVSCTEAEGPGRRYALWLQGCPLRCPGCCNPQMLDFQGSTAMSVEELVWEIECALERDGIEGISLLGGEPTAQAAGAARLAENVQALRLSVMVYSGFTLAELRAKNDPHIESLLAATDILVDGPYHREEPELKRRWIGSANQVVHFFTQRYSADDPCWKKKNTIEIRMTPAELSVNGFPAMGAKELWRGWRRR